MSKTEKGKETTPVDSGKTGKKYAYDCHCKGIGRHNVIMTTPNADPELVKEKFLSQVGAVSTDHTIYVGEAVEVTE